MAGSWVCSTPRQRPQAGCLPTSGYTADCASPEVPCSPRSSPKEKRQRPQQEPLRLFSRCVL